MTDPIYPFMAQYICYRVMEIKYKDNRKCADLNLRTATSIAQGELASTYFSGWDNALDEIIWYLTTLFAQQEMEAMNEWRASYNIL